MQSLAYSTGWPLNNEKVLNRLLHFCFGSETATSYASFFQQMAAADRAVPGRELPVVRTLVAVRVQRRAAVGTFSAEDAAVLQGPRRQKY